MNSSDLVDDSEEESGSDHSDSSSAAAFRRGGGEDNDDKESRMSEGSARRLAKRSSFRPRVPPRQGATEAVEGGEREAGSSAGPKALGGRDNGTVNEGDSSKKKRLKR